MQISPSKSLRFSIIVSIIAWCITTLLSWSSQNIYPLHKAIVDCDTARLNQLINKGADVNELNNHGLTPLQSSFALHFSLRREILTKLIASGAEVNKYSKNGWTSLHFAAQLRDTMALRILLLNGADTSLKNPNGKNAHQIALEVINVWRNIDQKHDTRNIATLDAFSKFKSSPYPQKHINRNGGALYNNKYHYIFSKLKIQQKELDATSNALWILVVLLLWFMLKAVLKNENSRGIKILFNNLSLVVWGYALWFGILQPFFVASAYIPSLSMYPTLTINDNILANKRYRKIKRGCIVIFNPEPEQELNRNVYVIKRVLGMPGDTVEVHRAKLLIDGIEQTNSSRNGIALHCWLRRQLGFPEGEPMRINNDGKLFISEKEIPLSQLAEAIQIPEYKIKLISGSLLINRKIQNEYYIFEDMDYDLPTHVVPENKVFLMGDNRNRSIDSHIWGDINIEQLEGTVFCRYLPLSRMIWFD